MGCGYVNMWGCIGCVWAERDAIMSDKPCKDRIIDLTFYKFVVVCMVR